jgi:hypothetical protein
MVSCKCDIPAGSRQIDPNVIEQVGNMFGGVQAYQTSANVPETQKRCLGAMIRLIIQRRRGTILFYLDINSLLTTSVLDNPRQTGRRRANSSINNERAPPAAQPAVIGHARRKSETAGINSKYAQQSGHENRQPQRDQSDYHSLIPDFEDNSAAYTFEPGLAVVSELPFKPSRKLRANYDSDTSQTDPATGRIVYSFLDMEEEREHGRRQAAARKAQEDEEEQEDEDEQESITSDRDDQTLTDAPVKSAGFSLDELLDRLVAQPLTKADSNFVTIFLALYRKFATPGELLDGIVTRFSRINSDDNPHLIRMTSQLRYLGIITNWLSNYPGDFSHPRTRNKLKQFTEVISSNRVFAVAAKEMRSSLEVIADDEDAVWGRSDSDRQRAHTTSGYVSTAASTPSRPTVEFTDDTKDPDYSTPGDQSNKRASDSTSSTGHSRSSSQTLLNNAEHYEQAAQGLVPTGRTPLSKEQYKMFLEIPDEEVAAELTRIDWIMFSTFRPRDLIRHISMSAIQREKSKTLESVNRMIRQFNHTAYWVANMVLLRDKPKHRALVLEKFMRIARVSYFMCF